MSSDSLKDLLDTTFEELVLVLGGAFAVHRFSEDAIWQIMKSVETVHAKAVARIDGLGPKEAGAAGTGRFQPHPAVHALLQKLRRRAM